MAALLALGLGGALAPALVEAGSSDALITIQAATCPTATRNVSTTHHEPHSAVGTCDIAGKLKATDATGMATGARVAADRSVRVSLASHSPERRRRDRPGRRSRVLRIQDVSPDRNWILRGVYGYVGSADHRLS